MSKNSDKLRNKAQAGLSLVDLMVGMVIALLGIVIIFQVFSVSESVKRTTTSGGDALQNATASLFELERSLRAAGYGIFSCANASATPARSWDPCGTAAVTILPSGTPPSCTVAGPGNMSDCLVLNYRPSTGPKSWELGPFAPQLNQQPTPVPTPPPLTIETITVQTNCGNNGSTLLQLCSSVNDGSGNPAAAAVLSDGIVLMKAEYGMDTTTTNEGRGDGVVTNWTQQSPGALNVDPTHVKAVRIVLVARSAQPEVTRTATGAITTCATTTAPPTWTDNKNVPLDLTGQADLLAAGDDWRCYRYKTYETTVPLRNVIWSP